MVSFVESITSNNTGSSFGVILNKKIIQTNNLFNTHDEKRVIFYDFIHKCIVRNAILEPEYFSNS